MASLESPIRVAVLSLRSPTPQSPVPGIQGKWNIEVWLLACVVDSTHEVSGSLGSRKLDERVQHKCNYGVLAWLGYVTLLVGCVGYQQLSCRCLVFFLPQGYLKDTRKHTHTHRETDREREKSI